MLKTNEDDLFRESAMTFGEHLEELRVRLFRAVLWLVIGVVAGFFVGHYVVRLIQMPMEQALGEYFENKSKADLIEKYKTLSPEQLALIGAGYISDQFYVEPSQILNPLRESDADMFQNVPPISRYKVAAADLTDARTLADELLAAKSASSENSPARQLWTRLDSDGRDAVAAIANNETRDVDPNQARKLAKAINRAVADGGFFDAAAFQDQIKRDSELKEFWEAADKSGVNKPSGDEMRRINWLALHDAFRSSIELPHPALTPITVWRPSAEDPRKRTKALNPTEGFMIYVKAAVLTGFILSSYFIFRELWLFVAAGLYPHERRYVHIFLPFSVGLFIAGAVLAFFVAFPPVLHFLFSFNAMLNIEPDTRISEWLSFALFLPFAFGIGFQLPLVMLFVNRIGLVSLADYWKQWRIAVLGIFVISMILCPSPDPYSMMLMAGPLTILYFGGIALCYYATGRKPVGLGE